MLDDELRELAIADKNEFLDNKTNMVNTLRRFKCDAEDYLNYIKGLSGTQYNRMLLVMSRDEQAKIEARIQELEYMLEHAKIIEKKSGDVVSVGTTVTVKYIDDDEEEVYSIVGSMEADPFENKISNESPIGKAIMDKKVGDTISVESPNGAYDIKIVKIA